MSNTTNPKRLSIFLYVKFISFKLISNVHILLIFLLVLKWLFAVFSIFITIYICKYKLLWKNEPAFIFCFVFNDFIFHINAYYNKWILIIIKIKKNKVLNSKYIFIYIIFWFILYLMYLCYDYSLIMIIFQRCNIYSLYHVNIYKPLIFNDIWYFLFSFIIFFELICFLKIVKNHLFSQFC